MVVGHYALSASTPVVIASVVGTIIPRIHFGDFPAFVLPDYAISSFWEFPGFALLGAVSAAVAIGFFLSTRLAEDTVARLRIPDWLQPACGGLAVGAIAVFFPHVLGVGYEATDAALKQQFTLIFLLTLVVLKTAATAISLGCRFGGGVFSPSLFIGAMTGGAYGLVAAAAFPELVADQGLYSIVGMGAVAAAVLGAPISTILIVFEMTGDYRVTVAVMLAVAVASLLTSRLMAPSFFMWQLERRGISLAGGRERHLLQASRVGDVMTADLPLIHQDTTLAGIRKTLQSQPYAIFFVVDDEDRLVGTLTFDDVRPVVFESGIERLINALDVARLHPPVLEVDGNLEEALRLMDESGEARVAVVDSLANMKVVGTAHHRDMLRAYNNILLQARAEERGEA